MVSASTHPPKRLRLLPPAAKRLDAKNAAYRNFVAGLRKESSHMVNFSLLASAKNVATLVNLTSGFRRVDSVDRSEIIRLPEHIEAFTAVAPLELQQALAIRAPGATGRLCPS